MKRMREFGAWRPGAFLLLACYAAFLLGWLLLGLGRFVYNRALYASGALEEAVLTMEDFTCSGLEPLDGGWVTVNSDPQMILNDPARRVDTLRTRFTGLHAPQVETAFYAKPGQPYSLWRMVYARQTQDGQLYWLPAGGGQSLRLDPDSAAGNILQGGEMVINEKRPVYAFFLPSASVVALGLVGPGLVAAGLSILREGWQEWQARRKAKGDGAVC